MDKFTRFLHTAKEAIGTNPGNYRVFQLVLGNESCDLDSTVSALIYAYLKYSMENEHHKVTIPIMNVPAEHFQLRTENCYALTKAGIDRSCLVFRDQVDFARLIRDCHVETTLVDHHILGRNDEILRGTVREILDHRPEVANNWRKEGVVVNMQIVGSCCTLVAQKVLQENVDMLSRELAQLLYETIIFDTIALLPENGKATPLDSTTAAKLEEIFNFPSDNRQGLFSTLWSVHNDVSHFTPRQLLLKDLKITEGIPVPGLPMLVEDFLKIPGAYEALCEFQLEYSSPLVVLVGLDAKEAVRRDVGVYWKNAQMKDSLLEDLFGSSDGFQFSLVGMGLKDVVCLKQGNTKLSRKQLVPIIGRLSKKKCGI